MAAKYDAVVNELDYKIDKLIKLYIHSLERNKDLENTIRDLEGRLEEKEKERQDLNKLLKSTRLANALSSGEGSAEAKLRINHLVREIDKCIALLND